MWQRQRLPSLTARYWVLSYRDPLRHKSWALLPDIVQALSAVSPLLPNRLSPHHIRILLWRGASHPYWDFRCHRPLGKEWRRLRKGRSFQGQEALRRSRHCRIVRRRRLCHFRLHLSPSGGYLSRDYTNTQKRRRSPKARPRVCYPVPLIFPSPLRVCYPVLLNLPPLPLRVCNLQWGLSPRLFAKGSDGNFCTLYLWMPPFDQHRDMVSL